MLRLIFTGLATVLFVAACAPKAKKDHAAAPTLEQQLNGFWELQGTYDQSPQLLAMKFEINRNDVHVINFCASNGLTGSSIYAVLDGHVVLDIYRIEQKTLISEVVKSKITKVTADTLQLDGKYEYRRLKPSGGKDTPLDSKLTEKCRAS